MKNRRICAETCTNVSDNPTLAITGCLSFLERAAFCTQNASLSKNERQLVIASAGSSPSFVHVAAQMRLLFGNIGSAQNHDTLAAQEMDNASDEENCESLS